jgi:hypothetical protein
MTVDEIIEYDASKLYSLSSYHAANLTCKAISQILGTTKTIVAQDSKVFAKEIGKYINSEDQKRGSKKDKDKDQGKSKPEEPKIPIDSDEARNTTGLSNSNSVTGTSEQTFLADDPDAAAFWPLIRQVNVRCYAEALSTGAVLVDLPGAFHFVLPSVNSKM